MATSSRTLKLSILADVDDLKKKLGEADNNVQKSASGIEKFGKAAAAAFAVAAAAAVAYASKLAIDGVKSAIEDEQAQLRLASALKTATGATDEQIKATEDYISKTQLATGVADNDLRNAFQRLSASTKDVSKSQTLLNLALDVSKGTGKDLDIVVQALAKSYDGQDTQLARLGIGLSAADLKAMDFTQTQQKLADLYGGAAARNAETFQGRIDRLKQGFEEAKEAVGAALLPIIEKLIGYLFQYGEPIVNKFKDAWNVVKKAIDDNRENFDSFVKLLQDYVLPILGKVFSFLVDVGGKAASAIINAFGTILGAVKPIINFIIDAINTVIRGINLIKPGSDIQYLTKIGEEFVGTPFGQAQTAIATATKTATPTASTFVPVTGGAGSTKAEPASVLVMPKVGTAINSLGTADVAAREYTNNYITITAINPEESARAIAKVLNDSASRSVPQLYNSGIRGG
jgi:hypothetical protein